MLSSVGDSNADATSCHKYKLVVSYLEATEEETHRKVVKHKNDKHLGWTDMWKCVHKPSEKKEVASNPL